MSIRPSSTLPIGRSALELSISFPQIETHPKQEERLKMRAIYFVIIHSPPPSNSPQNGGRTNSSPILGEARWEG